MKKELLSILADKQWKYPRDLLEAGTSYDQTINRMIRKEGYEFEKAWVNKPGGPKKFRLIKTPQECASEQNSSPYIEPKENSKQCVLNF